MKSLDFFSWKKTVEDEASSTSAFFEMGGAYPSCHTYGAVEHGVLEGDFSLQMSYFPLPWLFGWWFQICFIFSPTRGKIPILTNIFRRGWNHQLVMGGRVPIIIPITTDKKNGNFWNPWSSYVSLRRNGARGIRVFLSVLDVISLGGGFYNNMFGIFARETWKKTDHFELWL